MSQFKVILFEIDKVIQINQQDICTYPDWEVEILPLESKIQGDEVLFIGSKEECESYYLKDCPWSDPYF